MNWTEDFKENTIYRLEESTRMVEIAIGKITDDQVWKRPNDNSNSIGNLILHLCGNMTQYVMASLGEQEDHRNRDAEFDCINGLSKVELISKLYETVTNVKSTIENVSEGQLLKKRNVQGFTFSGMGCVIHAVEHYSYHTGQIAFWVKQMVDEKLGFYDGMDLNVTNED